MAEKEKDGEAKEVKVEDGEPGLGVRTANGGVESIPGAVGRTERGREERGSYLGHRLGRSKIRGCSAPPPHAWLANRLPSSTREYSDAGGVFTRTKPGEKRSEIYRARAHPRLCALALGFGSWLEPANYHSLVRCTFVYTTGRSL